MMKLFSDARLCFYSGPVAVFILDRSPAAILRSYDELRKLVVIAQQQLEAESSTLCNANPQDPAQPESCLSGNSPESEKLP